MSAISESRCKGTTKNQNPKAKREKTFSASENRRRQQGASSPQAATRISGCDDGHPRTRRLTSPHAAIRLPCCGEKENRLPNISVRQAVSAFIYYSSLGYPDSNQERQDQNLQCYHYTIAQFRSQEPRPPHSGELPPGRDDTRSRCTSLSKCAAKVRLFYKPTK